MCRLTYVVMALVGACGGFFVVPLNALLQERGREIVGPGNAIAVQNLVENAAMLLMIGLYTLAMRAGASVVTAGCLGRRWLPRSGRCGCTGCAAGDEWLSQLVHESVAREWEPFGSHGWWLRLAALLDGGCDWQPWTVAAVGLAVRSVGGDYFSGKKTSVTASFAGTWGPKLTR